MRTQGALLLAAGALIASCAGSVPQGAVLEFNGAECASAPVLDGALSLTPERSRDRFSVSHEITSVNACVQLDGANVPYVVYALPADGPLKVLAVGASLEGARIFAPSVSTLDASGAIVRSFERERYAYRGATYSVQFRPREGEAYVLVAADPALVGERYDAIQIGTSTAATATATGAVSWTYGVDNTLSRAFSYEGVVIASVYTREEGQ